MNYKGYTLTITTTPATRIEYDRPVLMTAPDGWQDRFTSIEQAEGVIDLLLTGKYDGVMNSHISPIEAQIMGATRYSQLPASETLS